jgi:hypothetical protein
MAPDTKLKIAGEKTTPTLISSYDTPPKDWKTDTTGVKATVTVLGGVGPVIPDGQVKLRIYDENGNEVGGCIMADQCIGDLEQVSSPSDAPDVVLTATTFELPQVFVAGEYEYRYEYIPASTELDFTPATFTDPLSFGKSTADIGVEDNETNLVVNTFDDEQVISGTITGGAGAPGDGKLPLSADEPDDSPTDASAMVTLTLFAPATSDCGDSDSGKCWTTEQTLQGAVNSDGEFSIDLPHFKQAFTGDDALHYSLTYSGNNSYNDSRCGSLAWHLPSSLQSDLGILPADTPEYTIEVEKSTPILTTPVFNPAIATTLDQDVEISTKFTRDEEKAYPEWLHTPTQWIKWELYDLEYKTVISTSYSRAQRDDDSTGVVANPFAATISQQRPISGVYHACATYVYKSDTDTVDSADSALNPSALSCSTTEIIPSAQEIKEDVDVLPDTILTNTTDATATFMMLKGIELSKAIGNATAYYEGEIHWSIKPESALAQPMPERTEFAGVVKALNVTDNFYQLTLPRLEVAGSYILTAQFIGDFCSGVAQGTGVGTPGACSAGELNGDGHQAFKDSPEITIPLTVTKVKSAISVDLPEVGAPDGLTFDSEQIAFDVFVSAPGHVPTGVLEYVFASTIDQISDVDSEPEAVTGRAVLSPVAPCGVGEECTAVAHIVIPRRALAATYTFTAIYAGDEAVSESVTPAEGEAPNQFTVPQEPVTLTIDPLPTDLTTSVTALQVTGTVHPPTNFKPTGQVNLKVISPSGEELVLQPDADATDAGAAPAPDTDTAGAPASDTTGATAAPAPTPTPDTAGTGTVIAGATLDDDAKWSAILLLPTEQLTAGTYTVVADYLGDSNFFAEQATATLPLAKTPSTLAIQVPDELHTGMSSVLFQAQIAVPNSPHLPTGTLHWKLTGPAHFTTLTGIQTINLATADTSLTTQDFLASLPANTRFIKGDYNLTVTYSGDASSAPSSADTATTHQTFYIQRDPTRTPSLKAFKDGVEIHEVQIGEEIEVRGENFEPYEHVRIELHSDPILLTTATADANGRFVVYVQIPDYPELAGEHHIWAGALSADYDRLPNAKDVVEVSVEVLLLLQPHPVPNTPDAQPCADLPICPDGNDIAPTGVPVSSLLLLIILVLALQRSALRRALVGRPPRCRK